MLLRSVTLLAAAVSLATATHANAQPYGQSYDQPSSVDELVVTGHARPGVEVHARRVAFYDLDISGYAGARTLLGRIRSAAEQVCSPEASPRELADNADYRGCLQDAVRDAVNDLDEPSVNDLYQEADWRYR